MGKNKADCAQSASAEHRWGQIVDSLEEGVIGIDADGRVVSMNQAAEQLTACSVGAARGRSHADIFGRSRWLVDLVAQAGGGDRRSVSAVGSIRGLWDKEIPIRASASGIFDTGAHRAGTALILQDLSVQRNLENDVRRTESFAELGTLVAALAHEIRNPLGGIRGAVQLLAGEIGPHPAAREYVDLVLREVDRLTKLVGQLLELRPRGRFVPQAVNIHRVIDHVLRIVETTAHEHAVEILRIFDPSLPDVRGDPDALTQLVLNLVQNALQAVASPATAKRQVRITTRVETDYHLTPRNRDRVRTRLLRVDVEDNGPGVPREVEANLFSPFVTTKAKGTGLGLTICQRIASDHGGSIRFESAPGRTLFRVMLPAWDKEPAAS